MRRVTSRGDGLLEELEPRSQDSRDWEGAVFSDGEGEEVSETRNDRRRFKRRVNRAIEALRADVAGLRDELDVLRSRPVRTGQRDGILLTLGKWIMRFVGVQSPWEGTVTNVCLVSPSTCIVRCIYWISGMVIPISSWRR